MSFIPWDTTLSLSLTLQRDDSVLRHRHCLLVSKPAIPDPRVGHSLLLPPQLPLF